MKPVQSSHVHSIGYDEDKQELHVRYATGKTYAYEGVSQDEHDDLMGASSIGSHLHNEIKPRFAGRVV
jgi:hypothetical protein